MRSRESCYAAESSSLLLLSAVRVPILSSQVSDGLIIPFRVLGLLGTERHLASCVSNNTHLSLNSQPPPLLSPLLANQANLPVNRLSHDYSCLRCSRESRSSRHTTIQIPKPSPEKKSSTNKSETAALQDLSVRRVHIVIRTFLGM